MAICVFGGSIAWSSGDREKGGRVNRFRLWCERKFADLDVYNLGMRGDTISDRLKRIEVEAKSREPDVIIFAIGINDARFIHSESRLDALPQEFEQNFEKLLFVAKKFTDTIIFVGLARADESKISPILWGLNRSYLNENITRLDTIVETLCGDNKLRFISVGNVVGVSDLSDGLHPGSRGHEKLFHKIFSTLTPFVSDLRKNI